MAFAKKESYKCKLCKKTFSKHSQYTTHMTKHWQGVAANKSVIVGYIDKGKACIDKGKVTKQSQIKKYRNPNKDGCLLDKGKASERIQMNKCINLDNYVKSSKISPKKKRGKREKYKREKCSQCEKAFTSKTNLVNHMRTHSGEKPFACIHCGKAFKEKSQLVKHFRTHSGEKPHRCDQCGMCFTVPYSLKSHMRIHSGEKPFQCSICSKSFTQESNLKKHFRTHTGEKPYKCTHCVSAFVQKNHLVRHLKSHGIGLTKEGLTEEKTKECNYCRKFFSNTALTKHIRTHTGEKPFLCTLCGKAFSLKSNLDRHLKIHSNIYNCDQCEMTCSNKHTLKIKAHIKLHSEENKIQSNLLMQLTDHLTAHTWERTYECEQYKHGEPREKQIEDHLTTDSRDSTYECDQSECGESRNDQLTDHQTTLRVFRAKECNLNVMRSKSEFHTNEITDECDQYENDEPKLDQLTDHLPTPIRERPNECDRYEQFFSANSYLEIPMGAHIKNEREKKAGLSEIGKRLNFFQELSFDTF